jgi:hypothetical protein
LPGAMQSPTGCLMRLRHGQPAGLGRARREPAFR